MCRGSNDEMLAYILDRLGILIPLMGQLLASVINSFDWRERRMMRCVHFAVMILRNERCLVLKNPFDKISKTPNWSPVSTGNSNRSNHLQQSVFAAGKALMWLIFKMWWIFKAMKYKDSPSSTIPEVNRVVLVVQLMGTENEHSVVLDVAFRGRW